MSLVGSRTARDHIHLGGDNEARIETDAELADQVDVALAGLHLLDESLGSGLGDGAEIVDQLLFRHADAGIGDGECLVLLVGRDGDREVGLALEKRGVRDRLVAQLVERVGGVRDQLAQEHVAVGIDRMHHEMEELCHLRLELVRGRSRGGVFGRRCVSGHVTLFTGM